MGNERLKAGSTLLILILPLLSVFVFGNVASATHFRYGHLTWNQRPDISPTTVEFHLTSAFRRCGYPGSGPDGCPVIGDTISEMIGGTQLFVGDGTSIGGPGGPLQYRITAFDASGDWLIGAALDPVTGTDKIRYTYSSPTNFGLPWTASIDSCCRISFLQNYPDGSYQVQTLVNLTNPTDSPVSSLPPIVSCPQNSLCRFSVPGADSDVNTTLVWRLSSGTEDGGIPHPPGLTVDGTTGEVLWNTGSAALEGLWATQTVIEDRDAISGALRTRVGVDYLIRIVAPGDPPTVTPPDPNTPPVCGSTIPTFVGDTVSFVISAQDSDSGDLVQLNTAGLPPGALMSPGLPASGNPVSSTFTWTPTASDIGTHVVNFIATDNGGLQSLCPVTVTVSTIRVALAPQLSSLETGATARLIATITDSQGQPLGGVQVDFSVTGANPVTGFTTVTDSAGQAIFDHVGLGQGRDRVQATAVVAGKTILSNFAHIDWVVPPCPVDPDLCRMRPIDVTVILARASDGPVPTRSASYFQDTLFPKLAQYHKDNSYGIVDLRLARILDNGGSWYTVGPLKPYIGNESAFVVDAVRAAGVQPGGAGADIVVVVHSGPPSQTADPGAVACTATATALCTATYVFDGSNNPWIIVSESDEVGAWAHEVGHDLGPFMRRDQRFVPHPTVEGVEYWDLMARGSWGCGPAPCQSPEGSIPSFMSSLTRQFIGLLSYDTKSKADVSGLYQLTALETSDLGDKVLKIDIDNQRCFVLEARTQGAAYSLWDTSIPDTGLVLYHINTNGASACGDLTLGEHGDSKETINVKDVLAPSLLPTRSSFIDWANFLVFTATDDEETTTEYTIDVRIEPLISRFTRFVFGPIISGGSSYLSALACCPHMPSLQSVPLPDLDLHVWTDDGRHIGMNYATGEFENQLPEADISGNQFNGEEWIVLPQDPGVHFVVSHFRAAQFLKLFPGYQSVLDPVETFTLGGVMAVPGGAPVAVPSRNTTIPVGGFLELDLVPVTNADGSMSVELRSASVTIDSLITELDAYHTLGIYKTDGAYKGLRSKLVEAKKSIVRGKMKAAVNKLQAFEHQLAADHLVSDPVALTRLQSDSQILRSSLDIKKEKGSRTDLGDGEHTSKQ